VWGVGPRPEHRHRLAEGRDLGGQPHRLTVLQRRVMLLPSRQGARHGGTLRLLRVQRRHNPVTTSWTRPGSTPKYTSDGCTPS
jgi:hypothetical protein